MISLKSNQININIKNYEKSIQFFNCFSLKCSCGCKGCLIKHGYYTRKISINNKIYTINILRVKCKSCGKTHAILPFFVIPYIRLNSLEMKTLCIDIEENNINSYDDELYRYKKTYIKFKNKLLSLKLTIYDAIITIKNAISDTFNLGFMQNHRGWYSLQ